MAQDGKQGPLLGVVRTEACEHAPATEPWNRVLGGFEDALAVTNLSPQDRSDLLQCRQLVLQLSRRSPLASLEVSPRRRVG